MHNYTSLVFADLLIIHRLLHWKFSGTLTGTLQERKRAEQENELFLTTYGMLKPVRHGLCHITPGLSKRTLTHSSMPYQKDTDMTDTTYGAKLQKDLKTYAIQTRIPAGVVSPDDLERIAGVARKYKIPLIKITSGQRFLMVGVEENDIAAVRKELGVLGTGSITPGVRYVQSCPGNTYCKNGTQDSLSLARKISDEYNGKEFPAKIKIGISGCPRCCGESRVRDIGIMGTAKGWTVFFGGHSGFKSHEGEKVAANLTTVEAGELVRKLLAYYKVHAQQKERTSRFLERVGSGWLSTEEFAQKRAPDPDA